MMRYLLNYNSTTALRGYFNISSQIDKLRFESKFYFVHVSFESLVFSGVNK